jgi:hypothetical protein
MTVLGPASEAVERQVRGKKPAAPERQLKLFG